MSNSRAHRVALLLVSGLCLSAGVALAAQAQPATQPATPPTAQPGTQPGTQPAAKPGEQPARQPGAGGERQPGDQRRGPGPGGAGGPGGDRAMSVEGSMKLMNGSLRRLRRALDAGADVADSPTKEDKLKMVNEMERGCVAAKGLPVPERVLEHAPDAAAKAKASESFRKDLIATMRLLLDMEEAINDGKNDAAKAKVDELIKLRDAAHKELGVKDD